MSFSSEFSRHLREEQVLFNSETEVKEGCEDEQLQNLIANAKRAGGPQSDSPTKACEARGCRSKAEEKLYFAVRFACREREDHAIICQSCFYKNDCPDHREGLAVDHGDYEANEDTQAWP